MSTNILGSDKISFLIYIIEFRSVHLVGHFIFGEHFYVNKSLVFTKRVNREMFTNRFKSENKKCSKVELTSIEQIIQKKKDITSNCNARIKK